VVDFSLGRQNIGEPEMAERKAAYMAAVAQADGVLGMVAGCSELP
jgi:hypothetical protein